jgi:hypothetical protein
VLSTGPAGEAGSELASLSINYWGSGDTAALASVMGKKNLKALALRGLGMLDADEPAGFYDKALEMLSCARKDKGFASVCSAIGADDVDTWLEPMRHRFRACFACPSACATFIKYNEAASVMGPDGVDEPGMLVTSAAAALWLKGGGWDAEHAGRAMEAMAREGIDMVRGARELAARPLSDEGDIRAAVKALEGSEAAGWPAGEDSPYGLFGAWVPPLAGGDEWLRANRVGYVLGICPTYLMLSGTDLGDLLGLCGPAAGLQMEPDGIADMFG